METETRVTQERIDKVFNFLSTVKDLSDLGIKADIQAIAPKVNVAKHIPMMMVKKKVVVCEEGVWRWDTIDPSNQMAKALIDEANKYAAESNRKSRAKSSDQNNALKRDCIRLHKEGMTVKEVAQELGVPYQTSYYYCVHQKRQNVSRTGCRKGFWSKKEIEFLLKYHRIMSDKEISEELGRSLQSVTSYRKKHNMPKRGTNTPTKQISKVVSRVAPLVKSKRTFSMLWGVIKFDY